jgi:hypothetical protein
MHTFRLSALVMTLALFGFWSLSEGGQAGEKTGKASVPPAALDRLIAQDVKNLQETLAQTPPAKKTVRKAMATALMLAAYAELKVAAGAKADEVSSLHAAALGALEGLDGNDVGKAQKLAATLPGAKGTGAALRKVDLPKLVNTETLMRQFGSVKVGGFGYEKVIEDLAEGQDNPTKEQIGQLGQMAYKVAVIGHLAVGQVPKEDEDEKKTRKSWLSFSQRMEEAAVALGRTAQAGNPAEVRAAVVRLNETCAKCHEVWR